MQYGEPLGRQVPARPQDQDIRSREIPELQRENGVRIRVITGRVEGISGPVTDIAASPIYLDVRVPVWDGS
jgi:redox-sensitive bicupin YhaK (pirin superfamily)